MAAYSGYGTAPDGRIFRTARGGLIQDSAYSAVWADARAAALADPPRLPEAVAITPADHPGRSRYLPNLGLALWARYRRIGQLADLDHSITLWHRYSIA